MSDTAPPAARQRPHHWFSWVWIMPLGAVAIVIWLAARALVDRGPLITISFTEAEGLQAGQTPIRHKDVDLGTVESIHLSPDLSRVIVRARMRRSIADNLTSGTRFWIVRPRVGFGGISGLSTLVSGSYIEMYPGPGNGSPQTNFIGLNEPPALTPDMPGRAFVLQADELGSLVAGSPVSYHGVPVGEIEGFDLGHDGRQLDVYAFVRAPYEDLVHSQSRFWNSGGVEASVGTQGVRFRAESWQQLISGGVSFETPPSALNSPASAAGASFRLYDTQDQAARDPRGPVLTYRVVFLGAGGGGVGQGTDIQLQGTYIGQVSAAHMQYDDATRSVRTLATLQIDPSRIEIVHRRGTPDADQAAAVRARIASLVARGLRVHVITASFLTGSKLVSLDLVPGAPAAPIRQVDGEDELPSTRSTNIDDILASMKSVLGHVDAVASNPALGHAIGELDRTLMHLDEVTRSLQPQLGPLLSSLRDTAAAAQRTLQTADTMLGNSAAGSTDLQKLMRELDDAARSVRALADYLDRHPEALIRGRKADNP